MVELIIKRDGRTTAFHPEKIADAVEKAFSACAAMQDRAVAEEIARTVCEKLEAGAIEGIPTVEGVQDLVEETLIEAGFVQTAKAYILYRAEHTKIRQSEADLKAAYGVISPRKVKLQVEGATVTAVRCDIQAYYAVLATIEYDNGDVVYVSGLTKLASISDIVNLVESVSLT